MAAENSQNEAPHRSPMLSRLRNRAQRLSMFYSLWRLRNQYLGKRCFVIGTGPSLKIEYLERLGGEYTFAANQIFRCFSQTSWRPSFYVIGDSNIGTIHKEAIMAANFPKMFVSSHMRHILNGSRKIVYFNKSHESYTSEIPPFSPNSCKIVEGGYTVSYLAMQIAWHLGFREIYTLGIDANYSHVVNEVLSENGNYSLIRADHSKSYFIPNMVRPEEPTIVPHADRQILAYMSAKNYIEANGGLIANAAPDSPLQVFGRKDLGEVLGKS
jgi:hypothetical protein